MLFEQRRQAVEQGLHLGFIQDPHRHEELTRRDRGEGSVGFDDRFDLVEIFDVGVISGVVGVVLLGRAVRLENSFVLGRPDRALID
jgi:hypothetical protein